MKTTLRSKLATAAMLLVPVGALFTALPAAADHEKFTLADRLRDIRDRPWAYDNGVAIERYHGGEHRRDYRDQRDARDRTGPQILSVTPADGGRVDDRGRTQIAARFDDRGTGVAAATLRVDGRDVTGASRVDGNGISYADNLRPGRHVADLVVRDHAGNITRRNWSFDVVDDGRGRGRGNGYGYGRDDDHGRRW